MNIESGPSTVFRPASEFGLPLNPFAALIDPDSPLVAHARMSSRVACTIHRPLERRRVVKINGTSVVESDDEFDDEPGEEPAEGFDCVDDLLAALESSPASMS